MTDAEKSRDALRRELSGGQQPPAPVLPTGSKPPVAIQQPITVTMKHNDRCPALRGHECACAANLEALAKLKPLERVTQEWVEIFPVPETVDATGKRVAAHQLQKPHKVELWKVDAGRWVEKTVPAVTGSLTAKPLRKNVQEPPRWVCTTCGWAGRGSNVSHRCDKTAVALATRQLTIAEMLTREQRFSGAYRLVLWRDQDQKYHLAEEFVDQGQVVKTVELYGTESWDEFEGVILAETVDRFSL
jgi:hypothetical protein